MLIFLPTVISGCRKNAIEIRHRPELPVNTQWTSLEADNDAILNEWWESLQDPMLEQLLRKGLKNNYNLHVTAARLEAASAQARIAGADIFPTVGVGWSATGQRQNFIGLPIPGAEEEVLSRTFKSSGVSLDVSWEPDVWGRVSAGKAAAIADYEAAKADFRAAKLSLVAQISKAWFATLEGREQAKLAGRTVSNYKNTTERVRSRYEQGLQSSLDLRLALSSLSSAEALLEQRKRQLDLGIRQIEILLGDYPSAQLEVEQALPGVPPLPPAGVPSELVSRRPDLVAAERRMWSAGARWTQARRALYPSFNLSAGIGTSTSNFLQVFNGNFFTWNIAGSVMQPLFQGGRLRAQIMLEDARSKEAAAQWASSVLQAFSEVEAALASEKYLADQEQKITNAAKQASASLKLAEDRYEAGLEGFVTVLEAQRRSLDAESQLLSIRRLRLDNRIDLHLALGGGFEDESTNINSSELNQKEGGF
jgi:multidrug efflux system outer membrane protein